MSLLLIDIADGGRRHLPLNSGINIFWANTFSHFVNFFVKFGHFRANVVSNLAILLTFLGANII